MPPENVDAMAILQHSRQHSDFDGRGVAVDWNYRELLASRRHRIIQPDAARPGGITAMKKIAAIADARLA